MRVHRLPPKPQFIPINLVLETQEEVDAITTIVNSQRITEVFPILDSWYSQLDDYGDYSKNWSEFNKILRK